MQEVEKTKDGLHSSAGPSTRGFLTRPSTLNLLKNILSVKPDSVPKAIDENGEPLAVYHGTDAAWDIYDMDRLGENTETNASSLGFAATANLGIWTNNSGVLNPRHE